MPTQIKSIDVKNAKLHLEQNPKAVLIDVREPSEIAEVATTMAKVMPMSEIILESFAKDAGVNKDQPLYILCRSGGRSLRVAAALADCGFTDLTNVEGGILAWQAAGLPIVGGNR